MNKGTKLRTVALAIAVMNQAIAAVGQPDFGNDTANLIYQIFSYIFTLGASVVALWFNNDFTVEADTHTKLMREEKALRGYAPETVEEPEDSEVEDGEE